MKEFTVLLHDWEMTLRERFTMPGFIAVKNGCCPADPSYYGTTCHRDAHAAFLPMLTG